MTVQSHSNKETSVELSFKRPKSPKDEMKITLWRMQNPILPLEEYIDTYTEVKLINEDRIFSARETACTSIEAPAQRAIRICKLTDKRAIGVIMIDSPEWRYVISIEIVQKKHFLKHRADTNAFESIIRQLEPLFYFKE